ncbi:MAG: hypothetical protein JNK67_29185 [Alphaproteobacteria bacterium]|nr:hypothetical protein [Alphaproteobacteria bacterium]
MPLACLRIASRRRLLLVAAAALLVVGRPEPARSASDPPPETTGRPIFLDIDRIVVTVFRGGDIDRHEMIAMKLELADDTAIVKVQEAMPRLRDAFIRSWNNLGAHPDAARKGLDVAAGRKRMLAACDQIIGAGMVRNVLIVAQSSRNVAPNRSRP